MTKVKYNSNVKIIFNNIENIESYVHHFERELYERSFDCVLAHKTPNFTPNDGTLIHRIKTSPGIGWSHYRFEQLTDQNTIYFFPNHVIVTYDCTPCQLINIPTTLVNPRHAEAQLESTLHTVTIDQVKLKLEDMKKTFKKEESWNKLDIEQEVGTLTNSIANLEEYNYSRNLTIFHDDNANPIAMYWKPKNILFCTDITHTANTWGINLLEYILSKLPVTRNAKDKNHYPPSDVSLGADPEFEITTKDGRPLSAHETLVQNKSSINFKILPWHAGGQTTYRTPGGTEIPNFLCTDIGTDGCNGTLELRPLPGTPESIAEDMKRMFTILSKLPYNIGNKGEHRTLGCHIHIGNIPNFHSHQLNGQIEKLNRIYDYFIGGIVKNKQGALREGSPYNYLGRESGALRIQQISGTSDCFEYRAPPSSITYTPNTLKIFLKIMKLVTDKFLTGYEFDISKKRATIKDYKNIGLNQDEIGELIKFHKLPLSKMKNNILENWVDNYPKKETEKTCATNDTSVYDSSDLVMSPLIHEQPSPTRFTRVVFGQGDNFSDYIRNHLAGLIEGCENARTHQLTVRFYGLNRDRGNWAIHGLTQAVARALIADQRERASEISLGGTRRNSHEIHFGLPWYFRNMEQNHDDANYFRNISFAISRTIEEAYGPVVATETPVDPMRSLRERYLVPNDTVIRNSNTTEGNQ
jgi:hypothetical protein